jgi:hypothetical protein
MKHLLLLFAASLFLGCSSTSLLYQKETITLQLAERAVNLSGKTIYSSQQNLGRISIRKHIFEDKYNERIVYEYARLQTGYTFKYNYQYILRHVFDAKQVQLIKDDNGLGFFTVKLKDGHTLNTIVKTGTKKSLTMLYGFSEENFKALIAERALTIQKRKETKAAEAIKSQWNVKLIIYGTLLEQEGGRAPRAAVR